MNTKAPISPNICRVLLLSLKLFRFEMIIYTITTERESKLIAVHLTASSATTVPGIPGFTALTNSEVK